MRKSEMSNYELRGTPLIYLVTRDPQRELDKEAPQDPGADGRADYS
jgi:hypothetical protein